MCSTGWLCGARVHFTASTSGWLDGTAAAKHKKKWRVYGCERRDAHHGDLYHTDMRHQGAAEVNQQEKNMQRWSGLNNIEWNERGNLVFCMHVRRQQQQSSCVRFMGEFMRRCTQVWIPEQVFQLFGLFQSLGQNLSNSGILALSFTQKFDYTCRQMCC